LPKLADFFLMLRFALRLMYLREVIINGFKSFSDRTVIRLDRGVTCIVGPNGCGKSNVVDAVRWVLGEQSAKALRGGKMSDVIFEGTDKRKPLNLCEVSLVFAECEKDLGTSFNEVEITRRITRDGAGVYQLNGKNCRLKDIQMLFMDTGIGRASYSFMAQGQIDAIITSSASDRRTIFEEAAGITRYKSQRKEALNKLALVEQNLSRVTDVIEEVSRQIGSLKRQASKALRYKRIKHRLTHLELAYNSYFFAKRDAAAKELEAKVRSFQEQVGELRSGLEGRENALAEKKTRRAELYASLQEVQQSVFDLRSQKEAAENQASFASVRAKDLQGRVGEIEKEIAELEKQRDELSTREQDNAQNKQMQLELVGSSDETFREKAAQLEAVQKQLDKTMGLIQTLKQDLLVVEGSITRLRQQHTTSEVDLKSFEVRHGGLADQIHELREEGEKLNARKEQTTRARERREKDQEAAKAAVTEAQEAAKQQQEAFRELQKKIQEADRELTRKSASLGVLQDLQAKFEGFSEGAKAILQGKLGETVGKDDYYLLTKYLEVDEEHTHALETLLGLAADALVLKDNEQALAIVDALSDKQLGRAALQVSAPPYNREPNAEVPDWLVPASSVVHPREEEIKNACRNLLAGCYLAPSLEAFLDFWRENPAFEFVRVATANGEAIERSGMVFGGNSRSKKKDSSFIQRENQIRKLKQAIEADNAHLTELSEQSMQAQADLEKADAAVEAAREKVVGMGQEISSLQAEERSAAQAIKQNEDALGRAQGQMQALENSRQQAQQRMEEARTKLQEAEKAIEEKRAAITQAEESISQTQADRDQRREALGEVRLELAEKRQRLELLERGLSEISGQRADLESRILRRQQELANVREQIGGFTQKNESEQGRAAELAKTLQTTTATLQETKEKLDIVDQGIADIEKSLGGEREEAHEKEKALSKYEVQLSEERSQANFLREKVQSEHQRDVRVIDWKRELWAADEQFETRVKLDDLEEDEELKAKPKKDRGEPTADDFAAMEKTDWDALRDEIKDLRDRVASLGAVNLLAIEEYGELKERHDFLKNQSDDLWQSKEELVKAIDEINQTSTELFQETFEQVRKNFKFTFEKLFGGGEADLKLIEAEDVLDSGIEVIARPPGTKLKSLSLLSGGQKTMTAVGLLFAIYMVKPSPFCVLDELDAPLDDANIGRFVGMLDQFTRYSQFMVITHNKKTIAAADRIYGVTMQERGVTKMLSMQFNKERGRAEEIAS